MWIYYQNLYIAPNRNRISTDLLNEIYLEVRAKVLSLLEEQEYIQFVLDESPDQNHRRIVNLSVVIPTFGSFYLENDHVGDKALTAGFFVNWFFQRTEAYCSDPKRIGSLATDTCATMRKTWTSIEEDPRLDHCFIVPCDSHGLQLFIKDILETEPFATTITKAQTIVSTFH